MPERRLSEILRRDLAAEGLQDPLITSVVADSRRVTPGALFAALPGASADGRDFVGSALKGGAAAVLTQRRAPLVPAPASADPSGSGALRFGEGGRAGPGLGGGVEGPGHEQLDPESSSPESLSPVSSGPSPPIVAVSDVRRAYALAARAFWGGEPQTVVAVTGTNGKTSVATFCRQLFAAAGRSSASLGTLGLQVGDEALTPPGLTTPDAGDLAAMAADLERRGVTHLALEASSHGLDQRRLDGLTLRAAAFLNLTQDHLDYHGTMTAYRESKLRLFTTVLPRGGVAVLNADSPEFSVFAAAAVVHGQTVFSFGQAGVGLRLEAATPDPEGQRLTLRHAGRRYEAHLPLVGGFQAQNALAAASLCLAAGEAAEVVLPALETLTGAPGRLQKIGTSSSGGVAYVDYAHTPAGLTTVLSALRPHVQGRLIVVFGAGGDRDRTKRPLMGAAAAAAADLVIVTDDNPRSEDPVVIRAAVLAGASGALEVGDRRAAIRAGVEQLRTGDVLVVAGKGHEQGQTVGSQVHPFDDGRETRLALGLSA